MPKLNNPEYLLHNLNEKILKLLKVSVYINSTELENKIKNLLRRTIISEILFNNYVIAIAGLQGVGKSSFIKRIYQLNETNKKYIPINLSVGEKLPILITEHEGKEYLTIKKCFNNDNPEGNYSLAEKIITSEEFINISKNPSIDDVILELKVPYKVLNSSSTSFILLPGLDQSEESDMMWEELTKHSLNFSASCLFLFDLTTKADWQNSQEIKDVIEDFKSAKPIFVITKADQISDSIEQIRNDFIKEFNLEKERVIYTDKYEDGVRLWNDKLEPLIIKHANTPKHFRKKQKIYLDGLLKNELTSILNEFKNQNLLHVSSQGAKDLQIEYVLEKFDESATKIKKSYAYNLDDSLSTFVISPIKEIKREIAKTENVEDWFTKIKQAIFGKNQKDINDFEDLIWDKWRNSNDHDLRLYQTITMNRVISEQPGFNGVLPIELNKNVSSKYLLGEYNKKYEQAYALDNPTVFDWIKSLLINEYNKLEPNVGYRDQAISILPLLALDFSRVCLLYPQITSKAVDSSLSNMPEQTLKEFDSLKSMHSVIISAIGTFMGLKDAADGRIDSIPALAGAFGVSSEFLGAVGGIIGVGLLVRSVINQINKMEIKDAELAENILLNLRDAVYAKSLSYFDHEMEVIRNRIKFNLAVRYGISTERDKLDRLIKTISELEEVKDEIREGIQVATLY